MSNAYLLAASYDLKVHVFDTTNGNPLDEYEISNSQANRLFSTTEPRFYAAAYAYIYAYDFGSKNKRPVQTFVGHEGNVTDIIATSQTLVSCGEDKTVKVWDRRSGKPQVQILTPTHLNSIFLAPLSDPLCVVAGEDGSISMWDFRSLQSVARIECSKGPVRSLALAPNGSFFIACNQDGSTISYRIENNNFVENYRLQPNNEIQVRAAVSPDSQMFVTCSADNTARIWQSSSGDLRQTLLSGSGREWIWDATFSADSSKLFTGGSDSICREWDVECGRMILSMPEVKKCVSCVSVISQ